MNFSCAWFRIHCLTLLLLLLRLLHVLLIEHNILVLVLLAHARTNETSDLILLHHVRLLSHLRPWLLFHTAEILLGCPLLLLLLLHRCLLLKCLSKGFLLLNCGNRHAGDPEGEGGRVF